jgi:hypothetical protein
MSRIVIASLIYPLVLGRDDICSQTAAPVTPSAHRREVSPSRVVITPYQPADVSAPTST